MSYFVYKIITKLKISTSIENKLKINILLFYNVTNYSLLRLIFDECPNIE